MHDISVNCLGTQCLSTPFAHDIITYGQVHIITILAVTKKRLNNLNPYVSLTSEICRGHAMLMFIKLRMVKSSTDFTCKQYLRNYKELSDKDQ